MLQSLRHGPCECLLPLAIHLRFVELSESEGVRKQIQNRAFNPDLLVELGDAKSPNVERCRVFNNASSSTERIADRHRELSELLSTFWVKFRLVSSENSQLRMIHDLS